MNHQRSMNPLGAAQISQPVLAIGAQIDCRVLEVLCLRCVKFNIFATTQGGDINIHPPRAKLNK